VSFLPLLKSVHISLQVPASYIIPTISKNDVMEDCTPTLDDNFIVQTKVKSLYMTSYRHPLKFNLIHPTGILLH